jgi:hypothetical protein
VLRQLGRLEEAAQEVSRACGIPRREAQDLPNLIDLSAFYNAGFKGNWFNGNTNDDLSDLPVGIQALDGTQFDVRGLIQLRGDQFRFAKAATRVPEQVAGLPTSRECRRVHFLHGAIRGGLDPAGTEIGKYVLHYADGTTEERALRLGKEVLDWTTDPPVTAAKDGLNVAWTGQDAWSRTLDRTIHLYKTTWENPKPEIEITSIDFMSAGKTSSPFLVAITVE